VFDYIHTDGDIVFEIGNFRPFETSVTLVLIGSCITLQFVLPTYGLPNFV